MSVKILKPAFIHLLICLLILKLVQLTGKEDKQQLTGKITLKLHTKLVKLGNHFLKNNSTANKVQSSSTTTTSKSDTMIYA